MKDLRKLLILVITIFLILGLVPFAEFGTIKVLAIPIFIKEGVTGVTFEQWSKMTPDEQQKAIDIARENARIEKQKAEIAAKFRVDLAAANEVTSQIASLPQVNEISLESELKIKTVRNSYDKLTNDQKKLIISIEQLSKAEERIKAIILDKTEPAVRGVLSKRFYKPGVVIEFSDEIGIKSSTLNNNNIVSGYKLSNEFSINGENVLEIKDQNNNVTIVKFTYDNIAPSKPVLSGKLTRFTKTIKGKGEPGCQLIIFKSKNKLGSSTVKSDGTFKIQIKKLKTSTKLTMYVVDRAGNKGEPLTVSVKKWLGLF